MHRMIILIITASTLILVSCASSRFKSEERWEGIWFNKMRVHVVLDIQDAGDNQEQIRRMTREASRSRAFLLLRSYIMHRGSAGAAAPELEKSVRDALETGKVLHMDCGNTRCEAFTEYAVKPVLLLLNRENRDTAGPSRKN